LQTSAPFKSPTTKYWIVNFWIGGSDARINPCAPLANPRRVLVYGNLIRIEAQKTQPHRCDPGCKRVKHCYFHDFKPGAKIYGLPDGSLLIK